MTNVADYLLLTAAFSLLLSLALAWLASFILYADIKALKRLFPASHQLIRAHIDYILMCLLLVACYYLNEKLSLELPGWVIYTTCFGALYNPFGFIVLAIKPHMAKPKSTSDKARILLGFLPATIGYGYIMWLTLITLL
ncbi:MULTISPECIES: hypothetical protein [unclassified Oleiphilus]|jgi:hypothetical protein|uniref:hypothetical protein n=1 Tax=unclassified Oleiphilus TaxID=2631174 RepID=UPI0007C29613|nr:MULTISPECIES: hypothetical protein [unclassified Oleiphilus]KZY45066.1 hypothetical protein A3732_11195 [Oleiphilus sp. HI0050]KZY89457.1 hypothetical protein A3743_00925 [Oleiphilus sp. HI0072]KZZ11583.1 hypothetical protein A3749_08625 [Oleiphilus sp. HI0078]KZZ29199.1 hypothetical protein A3752_19610 [Oleiphilus sp. HI0081]KZY30708.1 hypothetical protein A3729_01185 [Oleiphilus sp. HI0043]